MKGYYFFIAMFTGMFILSSHAHAWYLDNCDSRIQINMTNNNVSLSYYVYPFTIGNGLINYSKTNANGSDFFYVNATDNGNISGFMDFFNQTTEQNTSIYINMTNNTQTFFIYYNCSSSNINNISKVFDLASDDCEDNVFSDWTLPSAAHTVKQNNTPRTILTLGTINNYVCQWNTSGSTNYNPARKSFPEVSTGNITIEYYANANVTAAASILAAASNDVNNCYNGVQTDWLASSGLSPPYRWVHYAAGPSEINISVLFTNGTSWYRVKEVIDQSAVNHVGDFSVNRTGNLFSMELKLSRSQTRSNNPISFFGFCSANNAVEQMLFENLKVYKSLPNYPSWTGESQSKTPSTPPTCYTTGNGFISIPLGCALIQALGSLII